MTTGNFLEQNIYFWIKFNISTWGGWGIILHKKIGDGVILPINVTFSFDA